MARSLQTNLSPLPTSSPSRSSIYQRQPISRYLLYRQKSQSFCHHQGSLSRPTVGQTGAERFHSRLEKILTPECSPSKDPEYSGHWTTPKDGEFQRNFFKAEPQPLPIPISVGGGSTSSLSSFFQGSSQTQPVRTLIPAHHLHTPFPPTWSPLSESGGKCRRQVKNILRRGSQCSRNSPSL